MVSTWVSSIRDKKPWLRAAQGLRAAAAAAAATATAAAAVAPTAADALARAAGGWWRRATQGPAPGPGVPLVRGSYVFQCQPGQSTPSGLCIRLRCTVCGLPGRVGAWPWWRATAGLRGGEGLAKPGFTGATAVPSKVKTPTHPKTLPQCPHMASVCCTCCCKLRGDLSARRARELRPHVPTFRVPIGLPGWLARTHPIRLQASADRPPPLPASQYYISQGSGSMCGGTGDPSAIGEPTPTPNRPEDPAREGPYGSGEPVVANLTRQAAWLLRQG